MRKGKKKRKKRKKKQAKEISVGDIVVDGVNKSQSCGKERNGGKELCERIESDININYVYELGSLREVGYTEEGGI